MTFMFITSFGEFGFNSSGGLPAAEMALEDINNDPDILPGYNLVYDRIRNSKVYSVAAILTHLLDSVLWLSQIQLWFDNLVKTRLLSYLEPFYLES